MIDYNKMMESALALSAIFAIWAFLHSFFADDHIKAWFRARWPRAYRGYRLTYNLFAIISLAPVLWAYWTLPDKLLWRAPDSWGWLLLAIQGIGLVGVILALFHTRVGEFLGISQLDPHFDLEHPEPLRVKGLYCWVRHPIYFFSLLLLWFSPQITVNSLTIAILATLYFYLGAKHEEIGLRKAYGPIYDRYRQQTPMLIPRPHNCARLQATISSTANSSSPIPPVNP